MEEDERSQDSMITINLEIVKIERKFPDIESETSDTDTGGCEGIEHKEKIIKEGNELPGSKSESKPKGNSEGMVRGYGYVMPVKVEMAIEGNENAEEECIDKSTTSAEPQTPTLKIDDIKDVVRQNGKKSRVNCPICGKDFKNRSNLKNHLLYIHPSEDSAVECNQCFRTFKSRSHLWMHKDSVHREGSSVLCKQCGKTFPSERRLKNHAYIVHPNGDPITCDICLKTYKSQLLLRVHKRQVHPPEDMSSSCKFCNKTFKTEILLQRHLKWSHPDGGMIYHCQQCDKTLSSLQCYRKHIKKVHEDNQVCCQICSKSFKSQMVLERHLKIVDCGKKQLSKVYKVGDVKCSECDKMLFFQTASDWHSEQQKDTVKENVCPVCYLELADNAEVQSHIKNVHSFHTPTCNLCQKKFKSHLNLLNHVKVTHASPEEKISCDICQKTFKHLLELRVHKNVDHPKPGLFACDICSKQFTKKKNLTKHKPIHSEERPEQCDVCSKCFRTRSDLNKHKKIHNKSVKPTKESSQMANS